jgi:hypothetical protein
MFFLFSTNFCLQLKNSVCSNYHFHFYPTKPLPILTCYFYPKDMLILKAIHIFGLMKRNGVWESEQIGLHCAHLYCVGIVFGSSSTGQIWNPEAAQSALFGCLLRDNGVELFRFPRLISSISGRLSFGLLSGHVPGATINE